MTQAQSGYMIMKKVITKRCTLIHLYKVEQQIKTSFSKYTALYVAYSLHFAHFFVKNPLGV